MKKVLFVVVNILGMILPLSVGAVNFVEGQLHWYFPMRSLFRYLSDCGIQTESLFYFVLLTVALVMLLIFHQLVGIKLFDIYVLSMWVLMMHILTLPYFFIFITWFVLLLSGINIIFKRITFLYFSKVVIHLLIGLLSILGIFLLVAKIDFVLAGINILAVIILFFVTQHVIVKDVDRLGKAWLQLFLKSLTISFLIYLLVSWQIVSVFLMTYPDVLLLVIPVLLWLGRRTGLRLVEWSRFSRLIQQEADEDYKDLLS